MSTPIAGLQSEEALLERIRRQQLVESIDQMSPIYLEGMKRILTVSADTELISAPAYYHAGVHAPSLNTFGSAMSIIQDELSHAHIAYRLLGHRRDRRTADAATRSFSSRRLHRRPVRE